MIKKFIIKISILFITVMFMDVCVCKADPGDSLNVPIVGHTWVVDGYYYSSYESFTWSRPYNGFDWELIEHVVSTDYYHHFNWGYSGDNNGYYITGVFNMGTIHMADGDIDPTLSDRNYNIDVKIMSVYR